MTHFLKRSTPSRHSMIAILLLFAICAFEIFNFDTTRFALTQLMGTIEFWGIPWAAVLAVAFCGIDFAGLLHMFADESDKRFTRYMMAAWLLGATLNAIMTWYAMVIVLQTYAVPNELIPRERILQIAPIFVAMLVWLTRIFFVGGVAVASDVLLIGGGHWFEQAGQRAIGQRRTRQQARLRESTGSTRNRPEPAWQDEAVPWE